MTLIKKIMRYYKFRSLENLRYFLDIIVHKRLYAAKYDELNDPMEGAYLVDVRHRNIISSLRNAKVKTRICSLAKDYRHTLLWSHYANSHKGCCIEISTQNEKEQPVEIQYQSHLPEINDEMEGRYLLSHKSKLWEYEDEVRYFQDKSYLKVKIHQIIFGLKISDVDYRFYEKLIHSIDPNICVRKIEKNEINDGFNQFH